MVLSDGFKIPTYAITVVASTGALIAGGVIGALLNKKVFDSKSSTDKLPEKWVKVGELQELIIYPVKGIPGIAVNEAILARLGLKDKDEHHLRDRVFVIVNETGKCVTQKQYPILALTRVKVEGNKLHFSYTKDSSMNLTIEVPTSGGNSSPKIPALVMGEKVTGVDCGDEVASWLCKVTGTENLRLLYHEGDECQRFSVKRNSRFHTYRESHTGAFQDETSYMLMTDESVAALNAHLDKPVSHKNFRPTLVVSGVPEPFSEDFWGYIRFGKEVDAPVLQKSIPCMRCLFTTVDPETGTFRTDKEPLKTLYKMKRTVGDEKTSQLVSKAAVMGAHFGVFQGEGKVVRVGDPIYAALL